MLFDKLSPSADFISKIQSTLEILNGNILYITHEVDKIKKIVTKLDNSIALQKQVDEYFDERGNENIMTPPQTDSDEQ